jgi:hypothetical protein
MTPAMFAGAALIAGGVHADCGKLAEQFDWNSRIIALETFASIAPAQQGWRLTVAAQKAQTIVAAMIYERCPLPDLSLDNQYISAAVDCSLEQTKGRPPYPACEIKKWVAKPPKP